MNFELSLDNDLSKNDQVSDITPEKLSKWKKVLSQILDSSHSNFSKKEIIFYPNTLNPDRINFACPICGDSVKNTRKRRGNIYLETLTYHCFNGDCLSHMSLDKFFQRFNYENVLDPGDFVRIRNGNTFEKKEIDINNFLGIKELLFNRSFLKEKLGFQEIQKGSTLEIYLLDRYQSNFKLFLEEVKTGNLIILNCSRDGEYVLSFQVRTMKEKTKTENKYLTFTYSKVCEFLGKERTEESVKMDKISTYFGIFSIDWGSPINVFEGPMDSFLLKNSIGLCSLNNSFNIESVVKKYVFDYDGPGKKKSIELLSQGEIVFLWGLIINDFNMPERKKWDWNDLVIWCIQNGKQIDISRYFSNNKLDIIWM